MSVQLVITTLLAVAAVATASDDAKNVVMVKTCAESSCECDSATVSTQNYTVGECTTVSDQHWKVDSCTPDGADDITLKGYSSAACTDKQETISATCSPTLYQQATCETTGDTTTVKLLSNCTDGCASGCTSTTFTVKNNEVTGQCVAWGTKFLKLETKSCPESGTDTITFKVFSDAMCGKKSEPDSVQNDQDVKVFKPRSDPVAVEGKEMVVKKTCTASYYRQGLCTATNTASVKTCPAKESASGVAENCNTDCVDMPLELGKPWKVGDKDWVIGGCGASTDLKFKVYSGWKTYKATCSTDGSGKAMATCVAPQPKVEQPNPNPKPNEHTKSKSKPEPEVPHNPNPKPNEHTKSKSKPEPEVPQGNTSSSEANTGSSPDEPSNEKTTSASADNSSNSSGVDDGTAVPVLSAGVLLVLGVLECAFLL